MLIALTWFDIVNGHRPPGTLFAKSEIISKFGQSISKSPAWFEPASEQDCCLWRLQSYYSNHSAKTAGFCLDLLRLKILADSKYLTRLKYFNTFEFFYLKFYSIIYFNKFVVFHLNPVNLVIGLLCLTTSLTLRQCCQNWRIVTIWATYWANER